METKGKQSLLYSIYYSLPFVKKPQSTNDKTIKVPIEQQRILFELLKKDNDTIFPTIGKIKTFLEAQLHNVNHTTETTSYTWCKNAVLKLPETFCNGIVKFTMSGGNPPIDMSPKSNEDILPATQYWKYSAGETSMSDDTARTDVKMQGHYSPFDVSQSYFVGFNEKSSTIQTYQLPKRTREYTIQTIKENQSINIQNIAVNDSVTHVIKKPIFTKKESKIAALIASQHTQEIAYGISRDKDSLIYVQKIKNGAVPLSVTIEGAINQIVQLDCFNFICLTHDGILHRITKTFDKTAKKFILQVNKLKSSVQFSHIAIDRNTSLCAVIQTGVDHKDAIYTVNKNMLQQCDAVDAKDLQKIDAENPFKEGLTRYEDSQYIKGDNPSYVVDEKCIASCRTIAPKLQCHNRSIIAWYPLLITMSGQFSRHGNYSFMTAIGKYSAIKVFKTNVQ